MRVRGKPAIETGPPLLEREASLALLTEYAAQAAGGEGRLVLLSGEAGVGKSALVERLCRDLPDARWSWSMCDGLFTPRPLGPLFDLADQLGGALLERGRAGADREELFRTLLGILSAPGVLDVVVVEDIHWADEATLDLLRYLSRRLRGAAVLLIATYRDDGLAAADPLRVDARRSRLAAGHPARRAGAVVPGGGADAGRRERPARARAVPADRREPVLRDGSAAGRHGTGAPVGARRGAGAGGAARRRGARGAGCRGADRCPGRGAAAGVGDRLPAVGPRRAAGERPAGRRRRVGPVPPRDRQAGGGAGCRRPPEPGDSRAGAGRAALVRLR